MNQQLSWRTIVGYSLGDVANNSQWGRSSC